MQIIWKILNYPKINRTVGLLKKVVIAGHLIRYFEVAVLFAFFG